MGKRYKAERVEGGLSPEHMELMERVATLVVKTLHPLTGEKRGQIAAFRAYVLTSSGDDTLLSLTVTGQTEKLSRAYTALDTMLDSAEDQRRTRPALTTYEIRDNGKN